jgi:hypothetical protein
MGGSTYIEFSQPGSTSSGGEDDGGAAGDIAREDAALVAVRALLFPPGPGKGLEFNAGGAGPGSPPEKEQWAEMFGRLEEVAAAAGLKA